MGHDAGGQDGAVPGASAVPPRAPGPDDDALAELRAELHALRGEVAALRAIRQPARASGDERSDRRGFLRAAAGAAAGAVALSVTSAHPAAADTGDAMKIGQANVSTNLDEPTTLAHASVTMLAPTLLRVQNAAPDTPHVAAADYRVALHAFTADDDASHGLRIGILGEMMGAGDDVRGVGILGTANQTTYPFPFEPVGVFGHTDGAGAGVKGHVTAAGATGLHGFATDPDAVGVLGENTEAGGTAVQATALQGVGLRVDGGLHHVLAADAGPPLGAALAGQQHRDSLGDLYLCTVGGAAPTWRKVAALHPGFATAGGTVNLLAKPIRILDTRGQGAPQTNGNAKLAADSETTFQITDQVVGVLSVPAGATGIVGNLTCVDPTGQGYFALFPGGTTFPGTSNLNFVRGLTVANAFTTALSSSGQLSIRCDAASAHCLIDVAGFLY